METTHIVQQAINNNSHLILMVKIIAGVLVVSVGTFSAAIAQGNIAQKACESLSKADETAQKSIRSVFLAGVMLVETCALYCLIVAFVIFYAL